LGLLRLLGQFGQLYRLHRLGQSRLLIRLVQLRLLGQLHPPLRLRLSLQLDQSRRRLDQLRP
jgi:hypothetical protein